MKLKGAKKQTFFLTGINAVVRALGLVLRVVLSRTLGAEIMGISELAQSIHMVAITPLTSGLPLAISRMTARADAASKRLPLLAGIQLVRIASLILIPALWVLSPLLAQGMGDVRVLPSLWFTAPCILVLGYSAAYNGFCYGMEWSNYPAVSELIEQVARLLFTLALLLILDRLEAPWLAAIPVAATLAAEILGLGYVIHFLPKSVQPVAGADKWRKPILRLALPTTLSRLLQTLLRSLTAIIIPVQLQKSGLSGPEATAQLGMLNGMVMPILMLPCVFTSALSMVALPRLAKAEEQPGEFRRLLGLCIGSCLPVSAVCAAGIFLLAPLLSCVVYRMPELTALFRLCSPMTILFALGHLSGSVLSALGQQRRSLYASVTVSVVTVVLTSLWASQPQLRLNGVVYAQVTGQLLSLLLCSIILLRWRKERRAVQMR